MGKEKDKMRVLLIYPPYERLKDFKVNSFPYNLGILATCLEESNHYARIYNADASPLKRKLHKKYSEKNRAASQSDYSDSILDMQNPIWEEIEKTVSEFQPDIVCITCMTATFPSAQKVARIVKSIDEDLPVVMGGCHPTLMPMDVIKRAEVDFVVQGEGELSLVQLCNCLDKRAGADLNQVKGLFYKKDGQVAQNKPNEFINDLNALPIARRDLLLFPKIYNSDSYNKIMASRGCPYDCSFCSSPAIWKRKVRYRSPEKIIQELSYLRREFNVHRFSFWDDTFTANKKRVLEFCDLLIKNNCRLAWSCYVRANTIDTETLSHLKRAGCYAVSMGIESGSDRVLNLMKKGITVDMVRRATRLIREEGLLLSSFWMMGLPFEKEEDMLSTINLMKELNLDHINFCTFVPEPMTELYRICIEEGLLEKDVDWASKLDVSHHSKENYFNKNVPRERYKQILKDALEVVELCNERTVKKRLKSFWVQRNYFLRPDVIWSRIKGYLGKE